MSITLTDDQNKALELLDEWYKSPNEFIFTLYGAAGTGKTTLLNTFLNTIRQPICVTAPTHKAVRVVERMTKRKGRTLQSLHGFRPNFNLESFNTDNIKFERLGNVYMMNYKLVVIDEASQIGEYLQNYNELTANQYRTKILYVGDHLQLPPIKEKESKVFSVKNKFELKEIVRQDKDNPMLHILELLRKDVVNSTSEFLRYIHQYRTKLNDKNEGYIAVNRDSFKALLKGYFNSANFKRDTDYCRYAAWTNASILEWNRFIRTSILGDHASLIVEKDILTGYKTVIDEFNNPTIINSEDYIVSKCATRVSDDNFRVFSVILKSLHDKNEVMIYVLDHVDGNSLRNYYNVISKLHYKARYADAIERSKRWQEYFRYKDRFLVLKGFPIYDDVMRGETRGHITKDIDYGYGLTIHKLQGSTIDNIFVNSVDICYYKGNKEQPVNRYGSKQKKLDITILRNKLLYTAISRASKRAIILI